ncbi:hypothetical protein ACR3K2_04430 [Cryptosporidium serpentis]
MRFKATLLHRRSTLLMECIQGFVKLSKACPPKQKTRFCIKLDKTFLLLILTVYNTTDDEVLDVSCKFDYKDIFYSGYIIESKHDNIIGISMNPESLILPLKSASLAKETSLRLSKRDHQNVLSFTMTVETKKSSTFQLVHDCSIDVMKAQYVDDLIPFAESLNCEIGIPNIHFSIPPAKLFHRLLERMKLVGSKFVNIQIIYNKDADESEKINEIGKPLNNELCHFICSSHTSLASASIKTFFNNCRVFKTSDESQNNLQNNQANKSFNLSATFDIHHIIAILQLALCISDAHCVATITPEKYMSLFIFFPSINSQISVIISSANAGND